MKFVIPPDLSPEDRAEAERLMKIYADDVEANPLWTFKPHSEAQRTFVESHSPIVAAFAGNRFGKSAGLVVKAYCQHLPLDAVPKHLRGVRRNESDPVAGRLLCPSEQVMYDVLIPELQKWAPKPYLRGGSWDKAWDKLHNVLWFKDGGRLGVYTFKQEPDTMEGAALDYVGYDEPPPEPVRNACRARLADRDGFEFFALTPVNIKGGGIGWLYRKIFKQQESDQVTVVRGTGFDNPTINHKALRTILDGYSDEERRSREFGEFVHFGGMVYPGAFEEVLVEPLGAERLKGTDVVVGIDPGLRHAAFVWGAFDRDNNCVVFDEGHIERGVPSDYVELIDSVNAKWGLKRDDVRFVIDPSARNGNLVTSENVEGELMRLGIFCSPGQNAVEAGVQQVRNRMAAGSFKVAKNCTGLREEAMEYRQKENPNNDSKFEVVKENDHRLDAMRYLVMERVWAPLQASEKAKHRLGFQPDFEGPYRDDRTSEAPPVMGAYS